jgi:hypothetical protein
MEKTAVGIDVAKSKFDVAVWIVRKKYKTKILPNTPAGFTQLLKWLSPYGTCHICLEAMEVTVYPWPLCWLIMAFTSVWKTLPIFMFLVRVILTRFDGKALIQAQFKKMKWDSGYRAFLNRSFYGQFIGIAWLQIPTTICIGYNFGKIGA